MYILAIDQSTSATKVITVNDAGEILMRVSNPHQLYHPIPEWVEYDAEEIFENTVAGLKEAVASDKIDAAEIKGIGITNQTAAFVLWDKNTGKPVYNAIGWQCGRGEPVISRLSAEEKEVFYNASGYEASAFYPAAKLRWLFDSRPDIEEKAKQGDVLFGSMDSWLIWKLTGGKKHVTDYGNACITQMFNIFNKTWDDGILDILKIPKAMLPDAIESDGDYGVVDVDGLPAIPILTVVGDSNGALFAQFGFSRGDIKITYGTGASLLCNVGHEPLKAMNGYNPVIAWSFKGEPTYVLEGTAVCAGDSLVWLKEIGLIADSKETEAMAGSLEDNEGVYFVSAFTGLGTPSWNTEAKACLVGMGRGCGREHIVRAALEGIAYQIADMYYALPEGMDTGNILVDGGPTQNKFLMQFQADMLNHSITRRIVEESSGLGAAYMAGINAGIWKNAEDLQASVSIVKEQFEAQMEETMRRKFYDGWKEVLCRNMM